MKLIVHHILRFIIVIVFAVLQVPVLYRFTILSMYYVIACIWHGMSVNVNGICTCM